jgi:hypothetical protein
MRLPTAPLCRAAAVLLAIVLIPSRLTAQPAEPNLPSAAELKAAVAGLRSDVERLRSLVGQMQANLAQVTSTQTPLKHQFELEIDAWNLLLADMERRLELFSPPAPATPTAPATANAAAPADGRYHSLVENGRLRAFALNLPPHAAAAFPQAGHDAIFVAIDGGRWEFAPETTNEPQDFKEQDSKDHGSKDQALPPVELRAGEARFFAHHQLYRVRNAGDEARLAVLIELEQPALGLAGCACDDAIAAALCGCAAARHLPELWAANLGNVTLAGATLGPGEGFPRTAARSDSLLIAVTPLALQDVAQGQAISLAAGQARWLPAGRHQFRNSGPQPARLVTLELP